MNYHISQLSCQNIGVYNNLKIVFSPTFNIIIGPNGTGKTSILKLICLSINQSGRTKIRMRKGSDLVLNAMQDSQKVVFGAKNIVDIDQELNSFTWGKKHHSPIGEYDEKVVAWGMHTDYKLFAIGAHRYFNYMQISGMKREEKGLVRLRNYLDQNFAYLDNPILPDIKQWMINRYFIIEKGWAVVEKENWETILQYLPLLSPDNTQLKFVKIERDLEPVFTIKDRECYMEELSSGFKSVLSIAFSIIDWIEGVNIESEALLSKAEGTVLIDEVDVHLHPQWQEKIIKFLKTLFPKIQFIVTAHSPLVVSSAEVNEIIIIPENSGSIKLEPEDRNFNSWTIEDIMSQLMGFQSRGESNPEFNSILDILDESIKNGELEQYEQNLRKLKTMLSPIDPIIRLYEIKRSELYLNQNDKNLSSPKA